MEEHNRQKRRKIIEKKREKKRKDNKYLYKPAETNYYRDPYSGEYYARVVCYPI